MSKGTSEREHAKRRIRERFGIVCSDQDFLMAVRDIQSQVAVFIERQSNRVTVWRVVIQGITMRVCYDKIRKEIITVLPPEDGWSQSVLIGGVR